MDIDKFNEAWDEFHGTATTPRYYPAGWLPLPTPTPVPLPTPYWAPPPNFTPPPAPRGRWVWVPDVPQPWQYMAGGIQPCTTH